MNRRTASSAARWLRRLTVSLAMIAGVAQAATFSAVWDPKFGAPFTTDFDASNNLGWRSPIEGSFIYVPDECLPVAAGTVTITNAGNCFGLAQVTLAQVEFYNFDLSGNPPPVATLTFPSPVSMVISDMRFVDGVLDGLTTTASAYFDPPENLLDFGVLGNMEFSLFFTLDGDDYLAAGPHLRWRWCGVPSIMRTHDGQCITGLSNPYNDSALVPRVQFSRVPEPGSLALVGLALLLALPRGGRSKAIATRA